MGGDKFPIPENLVVNRSAFGTPGIEWLRKLPAILAGCEQRWLLRIGTPFPLLSYNYAATAWLADGTPVVVKVCPAGRDYLTEVAALRHYAGAGAVNLLAVDEGDGVMLLERLYPGTMLSMVEDDVEATSIAAAVMRRLWRPVPLHHEFPTVADWAAGLGKLREHFGGSTGPFHAGLVELAEGLFAELLASMGEPVILHGDLHHFNILAAEREPWLAIDPQGVVGEACYEVGALLRNPTPQLYTAPGLVDLLTRRVDQLADELAFPRERVLGWGIAQAVLSAWWFCEDMGDTMSEEMRRSIAFAEVMASVK